MREEHRGRRKGKKDENKRIGGRGEEEEKEGKEKEKENGKSTVVFFCPPH